MGAAIRNENVTPSGTPASTNPTNIGTAEHEQKGVGTPSRAASRFPYPSLFSPRIFLILSLVMYVLSMDMRNTIITSRSNTFIVSYMKKFRVSASGAPSCSPIIL